jgi:alcohol dehydrogenase class IV
VPTTSGTGSEVTPVAVITNREIVSKGAIVNPANIPRVAIVDPELTRGMPPGLTAATGADALGHALEAFISVKATPFVARMSPEAIRLIWENLPVAYRDGENMLARANMAWASTIAGIMLLQSGATGNHSLAQALGAHMHLPHGIGVAVGTLPFLEYCRAEAGDKYLQIARELGIGEGMTSEDEVIDEFIRQVRAFLKALGIPEDLKDRAHQVDREELLENAIFNAPAALANTPRKVTRGDMEDIISGIL